MATIHTEYGMHAKIQRIIYYNPCRIPTCQIHYSGSNTQFYISLLKNSAFVYIISIIILMFLDKIKNHLSAVHISYETIIGSQCLKQLHICLFKLWNEKCCFLIITPFFNSALEYLPQKQRTIISIILSKKFCANESFNS